MKRPLTDQEDDIEADDGALFRATIGKISPLTGQNRFTPLPSPVPGRVRNASGPSPLADTLSDYSSDVSPEAFLRNGLSRLTLRKLRRCNIQDSLDLHGHRIEESRKLLQAFLHEACQHGLRCVLVIHGKGMNSRGGEAVLRNLTRNWLTQHPQVLAFCAAPLERGGNGAVLVMLKTGEL